jgi:hypothetical protein
VRAATAAQAVVLRAAPVERVAGVAADLREALAVLPEPADAAVRVAVAAAAEWAACSISSIYST